MTSYNLAEYESTCLQIEQSTNDFLKIATSTIWSEDGIHFDESNKYITFDMVKYNELLRILRKDGWYTIRQKGSHILMKHPIKKGQLSVPYHSGKEVKKGLLRSILKANVFVIKEDIGYSATTSIGNSYVATEANSFTDLKENMIEALNFTFEESGAKYAMEDLTFEFDLESFFDFYKVINAKALSERIGMNQSLLAQYIRGIKKPSPAQTKRILKGVHQIGRELTEVRFLL